MPISTTGTTEIRRKEARPNAFPGASAGAKRFFTLPEIIAVMAILLILAAMAVPMLRTPSAAARMDETALEFQAFCGRVRFPAVEKGEDRAVCFDPSGNEFFLSDPEDPDSERSSIRWKLPEGFEYSGGSDSQEGSGREGLELFRYYPDGGASGTRVLVMRCGNVRREFRVSLLTGLLTSRELSEEEDTP